ncbi:4-hydroxy-2-oxo-heptane-1,7-dioate aldolase [Bosea sp. Root381]|uniref:HpcH/HpaI aldolase family protein n=1 Tax=Bosea sp. Root381 TaxID=1736524 RepID=UPI0006FED3FC|nr:aldolase/citrate lyase family protein [Bosea sp. Root381]KRE03022.1 4-hydroxy-2-oxo-heptane-1,7-dioate aldolase [Bosea sp. Root381]
MKLPANRFLAAIRSGQPQIGLWLSLSSAFATEAVAGAGFDWLLIDTEHSPNDLNSVMAQLQVLAAHPVTPIVRPDWNDAVLVKRLLDLGAPGLLFPMIQTPAEAQRAVTATRYPPHGIRGVSGCTRANAFGRMSDYFSRIGEETAVIVQIETRAAIGQALEIGSIDGVDGVFFGPADIAADIGLLGKPADPAVWDLIRPAARRLIEAGIPVGTLVFDPAFAKQLLAEGFSFVACGADAMILSRGADALRNTMKG